MVKKNRGNKGYLRDVVEGKHVSSLSAMTKESERDLGFAKVDLAKGRRHCRRSQVHRSMKRREFEDEERKRNGKKEKKIYKDGMRQ
jgi:hypothetical protein